MVANIKKCGTSFVVVSYGGCENNRNDHNPMGTQKHRSFVSGRCVAQRAGVLLGALSHNIDHLVITHTAIYVYLGPPTYMRKHI